MRGAATFLVITVAIGAILGSLQGQVSAVVGRMRRSFELTP